MNILLNNFEEYIEYFNYTLGLGFKSEKEAIEALGYFQLQSIILSDGTEIQLQCRYKKCPDFEQRQDWILDILPERMQVSPIKEEDKKLFQPPLFSEIESLVYYHLRVIPVQYEYALWGLEATDTLECSDVISTLLDCKLLPDNYPLFFEGLIINKHIYEIIERWDVFQEFKPGYFKMKRHNDH